MAPVIRVEPRKAWQKQQRRKLQPDGAYGEEIVDETYGYHDEVMVVTCDGKIVKVITYNSYSEQARVYESEADFLESYSWTRVAP